MKERLLHLRPVGLGCINLKMASMSTLGPFTFGLAVFTLAELGFIFGALLVAGAAAGGAASEADDVGLSGRLRLVGTGRGGAEPLATAEDASLADGCLASVWVESAAPTDAPVFLFARPFDALDS